MSLDNLIKSGIRTAASVTADLQASITHRAYLGDASDAPSYGTAATLTVIIEECRRFLGVDEFGSQLFATTKISYLAGDVTFGVQDEITMPSGKTVRILDVRAVLDKDGDPYMSEIYL